jgi:hypothetical protein
VRGSIGVAHRRRLELISQNFVLGTLAPLRESGATLTARALPVGASGGDLADVLHATLKLKAAASEVENAALSGAAPDHVRKRVQARATTSLHLKQAGFTQDAQVFGHVVRRDVESLRDLADIERMVEQQSDDADPGVLTERSERDDTVIPLDDGERAVTGRKTVQPNGLIRLAGF